MCVFCYSTQSSCANSMACVIWEDYLKPYQYFRNLPEEKAIFIVRLICELKADFVNAFHTESHNNKTRHTPTLNQMSWCILGQSLTFCSKWMWRQNHCTWLIHKLYILLCWISKCVYIMFFCDTNFSYPLLIIVVDVNCCIAVTTYIQLAVPEWYLWC